MELTKEFFQILEKNLGDNPIITLLDLLEKGYEKKLLSKELILYGLNRPQRLNFPNLDLYLLNNYKGEIDKKEWELISKKYKINREIFEIDPSLIDIFLELSIFQTINFTKNYVNQDIPKKTLDYLRNNLSKLKNSFNINFIFNLGKLSEDILLYILDNISISSYPSSQPITKNIYLKIFQKGIKGIEYQKIPQDYQKIHKYLKSKTKIELNDSEIEILKKDFCFLLTSSNKKLREKISIFFQPKTKIEIDGEKFEINADIKKKLLNIIEKQ